MKTIKIESIGHEPIFLNVPEGAKVTVENVKPEFKKGDCVKLEHCNDVVFIEYAGFDKHGGILGYKTIISNGIVKENTLDLLGWGKHWKRTKTTTEELQSEFNKLGYEYDFETHTAKKLRWKPEEGKDYFYIDDDGYILSSTWDNEPLDISRYNFGNCHKDEAEAQKFKEYILKYHEQDN